MKHRRPTKAEKQQKHAEAERRIWEDFLPKLEAVKDLRDALMLVHGAVPPDAPGRKYYSNLGFFLQAFYAPDGANSTELGLYIKLIERLDGSGVLKPGAKETITDHLRHAIANRGYQTGF